MERDGEFFDVDDNLDLNYEDSDYPREADTDYDSENDIKTTETAASSSSRALIVSPPREELELEMHAHKQKLEHSAGLSEDDDVPESMKCVLCLQLLLDPASLSCGHTFCQVCLVRMKMSNPHSFSPTNYNRCPMCRNPWTDLPAVNISFRDTLEQTYPQKIARRKAQLTPEELKALADQKRSRPTNPGTATIRVAGQANVQTVLVFLICICVLSVLALVLSLSVLLVVFSSGGGGYVTKPISHWSSDDVMEWMEGQGETIKQDCVGIFERERIDGRHLLLLNNETLVGLNITRPFTIESLLISIDHLKRDEYIHPTTFSEFKAAYPVQTVMLAYTFQSYPRYTFIYLYLFHYYEMFLPIVHPFQSTELTDEEAMVQQDTSWLKMLTVMFEVLVVPQVAISIFALGWVWVHPVLCCLAWLYCFTSFKREVGIFFGRLPWMNYSLRQILSNTFINLIIFSLFCAVVSLVLSVFPVLLLNLLFYLAVAISVYDSIFQSVVRPSFRFVMNAIRRVH